MASAWDLYIDAGGNLTGNIFETLPLLKGRSSFDWAGSTNEPTPISLEDIAAVARKVREDLRRCDENIDRQLNSHGAQQGLRSLLRNPGELADVVAGLRDIRFTECPYCQWLYVRSHDCRGPFTLSETFGFGSNVDVIDLFPGETRLDREHEARCLRSERLGVPERKTHARLLRGRRVSFAAQLLRRTP